MHHAFLSVGSIEPLTFSSLKSPKAGGVRHVEAVYMDDVTLELLDLFAVERHTHGNSWQVDQSHRPASREPRCAQSVPAKRIRRNRKRSDKQKRAESERRKVRMDYCKDRRHKCFGMEKNLRELICACVHAYAALLGLKPDRSILPFLPYELQKIMTRADGAMAAYRKFSGQKNLMQTLNELPEWW